ncbi:MAG: HXXEE domain-containing protein [Burkholderiales bacterium]
MAPSVHTTLIWRPQRMSPIKVAFGALVLAQTAHSIEEYVGRLWESFPPATFLTGLISPDRELGFIVINYALVAFGFWCLVWPVRREWPSAVPLAWFWIVIEMINGVGHPVSSLRQGGYTPGVLTAPILLMLALYLAFQMRHSAPDVSRSAQRAAGADH